MANFNIDYLVVAGGAGGGPGYQAGGGGAGGMRTSFGTGNFNGGLQPVETSLSLTTGTTYNINVGNGGAGGTGSNPTSNKGADGLNSYIDTLVESIGGGGGSSYNNYNQGGLGLQGSPGGSGGGSAPSNVQPSVTGGVRVTNPIQGFDGGDSLSYSTPYFGAGGGGAGGQGGVSNGANTGLGGLGLENAITGVNTFYAGGGGGGSYYANLGAPAAGGSGIGGNGATASSANGGSVVSPTAGAANTGSGGGGGGDNGEVGGNGGSGIVILRYATADVASYETTGIPPTEDTTTVAGQTILSFTNVQSSSITFTAPPTPPPPTFDGTKVTTPVTGFESGVDIGLKIPVGTNSNIPTGVEGMIRNDTEEVSGGTNSTTAITFYNGTDWKYFTSTESPDVAYPASLKMYLNASDTASYTGTGTTWFDLTDNNNDGTISGATWDPAGYFDFNGISDKINLSGQPFFPTSTTQSNQVKCISAWVQPDATSSNMYIFSVSSTTQTKDYFTFDLVQSSWTGAPALRVRVQNGGSGDRLDVLANITATNAWTHVLAQLGSSGVELYLNGISQSVNYATSGSATNSYWIEDISYATSVDTLIGQYRSTTSGSNSSNSEGRMSKVRIYDSVLTQAEITALHTEGP